jgi:16S rRNA (cytosine967-C5)-methyltransferase
MNARGLVQPPLCLVTQPRLAIRMGLYQIRFLDRVPDHAAVNDSVELARRAGKASAAAFVNAVLRRALREPAEVPEAASTPAWLLKRWIAQFGKRNRSWWPVARPSSFPGTLVFVEQLTQ